MLRMMSFRKLHQLLGVSEADIEDDQQDSASGKRPLCDDEDYGKITNSLLSTTHSSYGPFCRQVYASTAKTVECSH